MFDVPSDVWSDFDRALGAHGVRGLARACGVSPAFISTVKNRQTPPSPKILAFLGWERETTYRRIAR